MTAGRSRARCGTVSAPAAPRAHSERQNDSW
jgi:hypothetical protein